MREAETSRYKNVKEPPDHTGGKRSMAKKVNLRESLGSVCRKREHIVAEQQMQSRAGKAQGKWKFNFTRRMT